ncbi:hypothetical protein [Geminisphaera colitermitum]|uniref:hypothetical protein n=1 Tax=Geminisphaera colitermitum TaxID=1148786 RepID=UPI000158CF93|nr:hypothetical protein [Geminisphaera colitermitum]
MSLRHRQARQPKTCRAHVAAWLRGTGWLGVVLTLVLAVGSVSPDAHAWFHGYGERTHLASTPHGHDHSHAGTHHAPADDARSTTPVPDDDAGCVITLFSHGILNLSAAFALLVEMGTVKTVPITPQDWIAPAPPRLTHLHTHAPPAA